MTYLNNILRILKKLNMILNNMISL